MTYHQFDELRGKQGDKYVRVRARRRSEQSSTIDLLNQGSAQSALGVCYFDSDRIVRWANRTLADLVRVPLDRLVGRAGDQAMPGWTEQVGRLYDNVRHTGESLYGETYP